jgi:hypothetical protein
MGVDVSAQMMNSPVSIVSDIVGMLREDELKKMSAGEDDHE